jgi:hypothetical protein
MQIQQAATRRDPAAFLASRVVELAPSPPIGVSDKARQLKNHGIGTSLLGAREKERIHERQPRR